MKKRVPFSWKVEQYAFGAVALREEIKRHKEAGEKPWRLFKAVGIRALYVYAIVAALLLVLVGSLWQGIGQLRKSVVDTFKRKDGYG